MNRQCMTAFVVLWVICVTNPSNIDAGQTQNLETVVAQNYPQVLVDEALDIRGRQPNRKQCFAVLETAPGGAPQVVVAAYTNMMSGAIRLLRATAGGFEIAGEASAEDLAGWECKVEALDLDNDARKEAVVRFLTRNASEDWVFRWDGQDFQNLSATTTNALNLIGTDLVNTSFIDIDGDRVLEAFTFSEPPEEGQPAPGKLYRIAGGSYTVDRPIVAMRSFQRSSGGPQTLTQSVLLPVGAAAPFTLRIFNGAGMSANGNRVENAVESGRVWWNGQEIVSPNDFGNHIPLIERTVTLQPENELKVRLAGSPGGRIVIVIDAASWTP